MLVLEKIVDFIEKIKGSKNPTEIPPWHHELTPEHEKIEVSKNTRRQKETVERLRMEMRGIAKQHRLDT